MRCLAASILAFTCLVAGGAETSVDSAADAEYSNPNLRHAVRSYRDGELEEAWSALVRFFEDADRDQDFADLVACAGDLYCPIPDNLGPIVGQRLPPHTGGSSRSENIRRCVPTVDGNRRSLSVMAS